MNGTPFKLATIARVNTGTKPFAALVLGDEAIDLSAVHTVYRAARGGSTLSATDSIFDLLEDWDANFAVLQEMVAFIEKDGVPAGAAVAQTGLRVFAPVLRPGKMFYAAQNFQEHVDEMIRAGMTPAGGPKFTGEKSTTVPYLFLKAPSTLCGAFDDIEIPRGMKKIDWEAEIRLPTGKEGKRIKAERALEHIAGFMTTNDVPAATFRSASTGRRSGRIGWAARATTISLRWGPFWCRAPSCPSIRTCPSASPSMARSSRTATPRNSSSRQKSRSNTPRAFSRSNPATFSVAERVAASARAPTPSSDRKSTRLNSSHQIISYAVFCLKKKTNT